MRVLIFGGTSGIGKQAAYELGEVHFDEVVIAKADVRISEQVEAEFVGEDFEGVVYCAGVNRLQPIRDMVVDEDLYNVNVFGFMRVMRCVASGLYGVKSVVAVGSDAAERPMRTSMAYCSSKAALHMAVRCAARELAPYIRVNAVAPGMTDGTKMTEYIDRVVPEMRGWTPESARMYEMSQIPMNRRAQTWEVAEVIYSVLHGPEYQTGSIVTVNGGR